MFKQLLLTTTLAATAALSSSAVDFDVYNNGALSQGIIYYGWWNASTAFDAANPDGEGKVLEFKAADGSAAASMGLNLESEMTTGPLHSATLHFSWYAKGTAKYTIRLTSVAEENYTFEVTEADLNKWNTTILNVAEKFPTVAREWNELAKPDGKGYVFSVILENGTPESDIFINNVYYSNVDESWVKPAVPEDPVPATIPTPTIPAADVISVFGSAYAPACSFGIGGWGQSTQAEKISIDGKDVYKLSFFNYLGWELNQHINVSEMTHMHVDYWTPDGTTFGFTPISPNNEKGWVAPEVKKEEWNSYDVALTYFDVVDFSDVFQIKFDQGNGNLGYITNVYFYKKGEQGGDDPKPVEPGNGNTFNGSVEASVDQTMNGETKTYPYTINYAITWNEDKTLTVKATYVWANGEPVGVVPGSVYINNQAHDFALENGVRTATTSATYEEGENLSLNFYLPMALGVVEKAITYTVGSKSEGEGGGDDPTPKPEPGATYSGVITNSISQSIEGVDKTYPYTIKYEIIYNEDKTITTKAEYTWPDGEPVGLVDGSVQFNGGAHINATKEGNMLTATSTDTFDAGAVIPVHFYRPMANTAASDIVSYTVGSSNQETEGIDELSTANPGHPTAIYDLQGRRLAAPHHGLNIINGRKVYVK